MNNEILLAVRARYAAASSRASKLRAQLEAAEAECRDYQTTIKVLESVTGDGAPSAPRESTGSTSSDGPTMPELILLALDDGPKPIADIIEAITGLTDKSVDPNNIRSTAWRMWKADRIGRSGDDYHLMGQEPEAGKDLLN